MNMDVKLLRSIHDFSIDCSNVESPLRMQAAVKEEKPRLSSHLFIPSTNSSATQSNVHRLILSTKWNCGALGLG